MTNFKKLLQISCILVAVHAGYAVNQLPVVDLGYEIYQATGANNVSRFIIPTSHSDTKNEIQQSLESYDSFSNIRFASAPIGDLRWKAPVPPKTNRSAVLSNSKSITCVQGASSWQLRTSQYTNDYLKTGDIPNVSYSDMSAISAGGVEDCLFLDVQVPRKVFNNGREKRRLAPVLVWIHGKSPTITVVYRNAKKNKGGGFTAGSETPFGSPNGLVDRSQAGRSDGIVYVAFNYRLGAFDFLSGPSFQAEGGMFNAGLYDQRFALQWIQDNIHLLGADKERVTVFGDPGGGGSIMHHVTAYRGTEPALFNQAVSQSPAYFPYRSLEDQEKAFKQSLRQTNVESLAEARKLCSDVLIVPESITTRHEGRHVEWMRSGIRITSGNGISEAPRLSYIATMYIFLRLSSINLSDPRIDRLNLILAPKLGLIYSRRREYAYRRRCAIGCSAVGNPKIQYNLSGSS